jgi:hypothetical protein
MYLRETRQRRASGEVVTYLQLVESVWDPEKKRPQVRVVLNLGRTDDAAVRERLRALAQGILRRVAPEDLVRERADWKLIDSWPYGDLYAMEQLWTRLGLKELLPGLVADATRTKLPVERAAFAMVANRALAPCSKLYCYEQWLREDVIVDGAAGLRLDHLYRTMDFFEKHKEKIEKALFFRLSDLFACDVELIFYDTTTLHFEIDEEDAGGAEGAVLRGSKLAGAKTYPAYRQRGKAKNKRSDVPQIVVGLAMTRDGLPVRSWIFRGDTVDVTTVKQVKEDLRGWRLTRCVFVGDAGMVSADNLRELARGGGRYILCMPIRHGTDVADEVVKRAGRYKPVAQNLRVKQVTVGTGERRRRYVVCFNPDEAARQKHHREQALKELAAELASMRVHVPGDEHTKRECALRASERYGKYLRLRRGGRLVIDRSKVRAAEKLDGKFVVHSNDDTLTAEDLALGYKQLARVEQAWRLLKSGIRFRPIYHWRPHRISAHVSLTMLALLLERLAENTCGDTWRNIRDDLRQIKLARLSSPHGEVWQVTEGTEDARRRLKQLGIPPPPSVLNLDPTPRYTPASRSAE